MVRCVGRMKILQPFAIHPTERGMRCIFTRVRFETEDTVSESSHLFGVVKSIGGEKMGLWALLWVSHHEANGAATAFASADA